MATKKTPAKKAAASEKLFEGYERREAKILAALKPYGIKSIPECRDICLKAGFDPYKIVEETQPICFENAKWAYTVGAGLEDLGKGLRSMVGTMYATKAKGPRYLEMTEGYCTRMALNKDGEVIGYEFVSLGKMTDFIKKGLSPNEAWEKAKGHYGQFEGAAKYIDPRKE